MNEEKLKFALKICIESLTWIAENSDVTTSIFSQRANVTVEETDRILRETDESNYNI